MGTLPAWLVLRPCSLPPRQFLTGRLQPSFSSPSQHWPDEDDVRQVLLKREDLAGHQGKLQKATEDAYYAMEYILRDPSFDPLVRGRQGGGHQDYWR